ncbi:MAG: flagellar basal-body MS-ring/collar protein FliF [Acidimicrobiia bacterium]
MAALDIRQMGGKMKTLTDGFTTPQKFMFALTTVGVIVGLLVFSKMGAGQQLSPLFSNLEASDASEITTKLSAQGVKYELRDGGKTIAVPQDQVYQLRLDLSAAGLPTGGQAGYALLDKQGITTSVFRQRVDYQRALEGELAKTIQVINGVKAATVHLVIPADDVFAKDSQKATASVLVQTGSARTIDDTAVRSIVNLVASSVPELSTNEITVADANGNTLWAPGSDAGAGAAADIANRKTMQFEQDLAKQLESKLALVTGPGKVAVQVKADLDFDQRESTATIYQAPNKEGEDPLVKTQVSTKEVYNGNGTSVAGTLGVDGQPLATATTVPAAGAAAGTATTVAGANSPTYTNTSDQSEKVFNTRVDAVKTAPGRINKLSVAVMVDEDAIADDAVTKLSEIVQKGAGITADDLTVQRIKFDTTVSEAAKAELTAAAKAKSSGSLMNLISTVGVILITLAALFFAWRSLKKAAKRAPRVIDVRELEAVREELRELTTPDGRAVAARNGDPMALPAADEAYVNEDGVLQLPPVPVSEESRAVAAIEAEINDMIERQPQDVAVVLRNWLGERRVARR